MSFALLLGTLSLPVHAQSFGHLPVTQLRPIGHSLGSLPHLGPHVGHGGPSMPRPGAARSAVHFGQRTGTDVQKFDPHHLRLWRGGQWRHETVAGRTGWWWRVGGRRYFYEKPVRPYPMRVSSVSAEDPLMEIIKEVAPDVIRDTLDLLLQR